MGLIMEIDWFFNLGKDHHKLPWLRSNGYKKNRKNFVCDLLPKKTNNTYEIPIININY